MTGTVQQFREKREMKNSKSLAGIFIKATSMKAYPMIMMMILAVLLILPSFAEASIGRISSYKGDVLVQSGDTVTKVAAVGHQVKTGDFLLTQNGEAQVTFTDGGVVKVNPKSKIMITERPEQSGTFFKKTSMARRITVFVGKLWFKSGQSRTNNFLQSPTVVCGIRGSDADYGYNPTTMQTFLQMYSGEAAVTGNVIRGFFENPGITEAAKSKVYQALVQAHEKTEQAKATGNAVDQAQAKVETLAVVKEAALILIQNNPDEKVKEMAQTANATVDANIAAAKAKVAAEQIKEKQKELEKAAKEEKDPAKEKEKEAAAKKAAEEVKKAEQAAKAAEQAAKEANKIADAPNPDLNKLEQLAEQAKQEEAKAVQIQQEVAPTTVAPTTVAPTTVAQTTSVMPTTVEVTTTTSSTTSSTTSTVKPTSPP